MNRLVKSIFLISLFLFFCSTFVFAEEITITTYYPSPYGVYKTLRLYPQAGFVAGAACINPGEMVYDSAGNQLLGCAGSTPVWQALGGGGGGWMDSGTVVSLTTNTDNVGIGTAAPTNAKLQITSDSALIGNIGIGGPNFRDMWFDGGTDGDFLFVNTGAGTGKTTFTYDPNPPGGIMVDSLTLMNNGRVGIGTTNPNSKLEVTGGIGVNRAVAVATGNIDISGSYLVNGADYAEYFEKEGDVVTGDIVGINMATGKARKYALGDAYIGIAGDTPGIVGNNKDNKEGYALVGLLGQIDFKQDEVVIEGRIVQTKDGKRIGVLLSNGKVLIGT